MSGIHKGSTRSRLLDSVSPYRTLHGDTGWCTGMLRRCIISNPVFPTQSGKNLGLMLTANGLKPQPKDYGVLLNHP
jgi:hypothetical protein